MNGESANALEVELPQRRARLGVANSCRRTERREYADGTCNVLRAGQPAALHQLSHGPSFFAD